MMCASLIQDCDFIWNQVHPSHNLNNYKFMSLIQLNYIMGLEITGCNFINEDTRSFTHSGANNPSNPNDGAIKRGKGIYSQNSSYWVRKTGIGTDTDNDGCPDFSGDPCTFKQLSAGIEWNGVKDGLVSCDLTCEAFEDDDDPTIIVSEYETMNVTESVFENCWVSIGAQYDGQEFLIAENTFTFNTEIKTSSGTYWKNIDEDEFILRFIHLQDVFDYTIYNNTFTNTTLDYCRMLFISNFECGSTSLIQANEFFGPSPADNNTVAIQLTDNGDPTNTTSNNNLLMLCNDIDEFEIGIYIDDPDVFLIDQEAGIGSDRDTRNTFNCPLGKDIVNNGQPFTYYHNLQSPMTSGSGIVILQLGSDHETCALSCDGWPTVSLKEVPEQITASVYPNPSTGLFTIETTSQEIGHVLIYNLSGALVYQNRNPANSSVDLSALPNGMYLMQLQVDEHITNHRIIISK